MERVSKDRIFSLAARDLNRELDEIYPGLDSVYQVLDLKRFPPGADYFILSSAVMCTCVAVGGWLDKLSNDLDIENVISSLEFNWRRRLRSDPDWATKAVEWSNRINRVKRRAMKMLGEARAISPPEAAAPVQLERLLEHAT